MDDSSEHIVKPLSGTSHTKLYLGIVILILLALALYVCGATGYVLGVKQNLDTGTTIKLTAVVPTLPDSSIIQITPTKKPDKNDMLKQLLNDTTTINYASYSGNNKYVYIDVNKPAGRIYPADAPDIGLEVHEDIVLINLLDKSRQNLDLIDLLHPQFTTIWKKGEVNYRLEFTNILWSQDETVMWGTTWLLTNADPPIAEELTLDKIDMAANSVDLYALPSDGLIKNIMPTALNTESETVLIETTTPTDNLTLYGYNLNSKKKIKIVDYSKDELIKVFGENYVAMMYYDLSPWSKRKSLEPKWVDNSTITYKDILTGELITKKINL